MFFDVQYLGSISGVSIAGPSSASKECIPRPTEVQLVDRIEHAQIDGRLPITVSTNYATLTFDKHGLKLYDSSTKEVLERLPLHTIAQAVTYDDGCGHWNVILKCGQMGKSIFTCYVLQTAHQDYAKQICTKLNDVLRTVTETS